MLQSNKSWKNLKHIKNFLKYLISLTSQNKNKLLTDKNDKMKRKLFYPALIILALMIVIVSCKKDDDDDNNSSDTTAPVITLKGTNPTSVNIGATYSDAGATALDNVDGDISASITSSGTVNTAQKGTFTKTYTVSDAAGNTATATRTVNVVNSADFLAGHYHVTDLVNGLPPALTYDINVLTLDAVNNKFLIYNFGNYGTSVYTEATLSTATTLLITSQSPYGMSNPGTVSGSGTATTSAGITHLNYSCAYTSGGTDNGSASCTKF
jgi:hypothetical protein